MDKKKPSALDDFFDKKDPKIDNLKKKYFQDKSYDLKEGENNQETIERFA